MLETALAAVRAGQELLVGQSSGKPVRPSSIFSKAPHDYQTDMDVLVEKRIAEVILSRFPDHGIQGEESAAENTGSEHVWYIDPIDGTRNYIEGRPEIAISVALYTANQPVVGVISLPFRGLVIAASRGQDGIIVNGSITKLKPTTDSLDHALVCIQGDIRSQRDTEAFRQVAWALVHSVEGFRITGALAYDLACVALAEVSARISLTAKPVDTAAGAFIITQGGGTVTDARGGPWSLESRTILASSSPTIHASLLNLVSELEILRNA